MFSITLHDLSSECKRAIILMMDIDLSLTFFNCDLSLTFLHSDDGTCHVILNIDDNQKKNSSNTQNQKQAQEDRR